MFKKLLFVFFIITTNVYSQKRDCSGYHPLYLSGDRVIYTDSIIANDVRIYTDSVVLDIFVSYIDSSIIDNFVIYTDSVVSYSYPLTNNPPFKNAVYRDYCEFFREMFFITTMLWRQERVRTSDEEKKYYIFSANNRFINYTSVSKNNGELYAKYNPTGKDNKNSFSFSQRQFDKLTNWVLQEMDKGLKVSVGSKNKKTYIAKSFSDF
jgi:hypothetical protein